MAGIRYLLVQAIDIYMIIIVIRAVMSWFSPNPYNRFFQFLISITEPVLGRIRRFLPVSGIDFSPFIVIILLSVLRSIIIRA